MRDTDTIFALSTGLSQAAIQVIRISGQHVAAISAILCPHLALIPRMSHYSTIYDSDGTMIDKAIIILYVAPHSFTGDMMLELHCHGGRAIYQKLATTLSPMARPALPGEFSYRAMIHGKISLHEAESINDLVHAETEQQRKYALYHVDGLFNAQFSQWRDMLLNALAHLEACLDFADEELPDTIWRDAMHNLHELRNILYDVSHNNKAERLKNGIHIALIGLPNAGKSTLMNALCDRNIAIVHEEAGTTRDMIEATLDINGYPVVLMDVAGLRDTDNAIEQQGIDKAKQAADIADIRLFLYDSTSYEHDKKHLARWVMHDKEHDIYVATKNDLYAIDTPSILSISAKDGTNMGALIQTITHHCDQLTPTSHDLSLSYERQKDCVRRAMHAIDEALHEDYPELVAENLRHALRSLSELTGHVHSEQILDVLFKDFCIGK